MTALPPEERPPGRPEPIDPALGTGAIPGRPASGPSYSGPSDEILGLLAGVVVFEASVEDHDGRRPTRGHPFQLRRWRREHEVLQLQRQVLKLRIEALPHTAYLPFPRPCL
jgi:hypothetical protein